ncbi:hypothetical protein BDV95DRAFT_602280 [Massariosphaeria phaeospora]|uniref:Uncharacterized protein n=1 Tax=Massariosphaeria phaeospora TaxID=100035 RepID=A0A7C8ICK8_9PLEO|nr:hypothetical protein BDV95DRAFT_602280 [Massariosphaeria phaeospora]
MSSEQKEDNTGVLKPREPDLAQAFQELARGESAAAALENHLDSVEKKIEALLAKADEDERKLKAQTKESSERIPSSNDEKKSSA